MAHSLRTIFSIVLSVLCLSLVFQASAQTTVVHSLSTGVSRKSISTVSSQATTTIAHDFASSSQALTAIAHSFATSTKSDAAEKTPDPDGIDGEACTADGMTLNRNPPLCELKGNGDFYGLGVRLGIYFSWLTSWIANNLLPDEMAGAFDTNSIFLFALVLVALFYSVQYQLNALDALVLLQLAFGFVFSVMSLWGFRTMYYRTGDKNGQKHFGGWGTHIRLLLNGTISVYGSWFWIEGLGDGLPGCAQMIREPCDGLRTFMFANVNVYGPVRWIHAAAALVCCVYYGIMILAALACAVDHVLNRLRKKQNDWVFHELDLSSDGPSQHEWKMCSRALSAFNFLWMVWAASNVEYTLNFNHVRGVLAEDSANVVTAGQLLPMLIGLFSFIRVCYLLYRDKYPEWRKKMAEKKNYGLGVSGVMSGKTAVESPTTPTVKRQGSQRRTKKNLVHRVVTAWLPWLSTYEWWRGDTRRGNFELLSETPYMPQTPLGRDIEMRSTDEITPSRKAYVADDVDTEYHGNGA